MAEYDTNPWRPMYGVELTDTGRYEVRELTETEFVEEGYRSYSPGPAARAAAKGRR